MKNTWIGKESNQSNHETRNQGELVDVLYQKMGDRWFAFSLIDDEVFVGSIAQEEIENIDKQVSQ